MNIYPPPLSVYKKNYIGLCQTIIVPSLVEPLLTSNTTKQGHKCFKPKLWMILTNKPLFVENVSWWVSRQFVDGYPTIFNQFPVKRWLETASQAVKVNLSFHSQTPFCVQKNEGRSQKTSKLVVRNLFINDNMVVFEILPSSFGQFQTPMISRDY